METIRYELKYCERCGTLKLRPVASASTYCRRCERLLARFTLPRGPPWAAGCRLPSEVAGWIPLPVSDRLPGRVQ